MLYLIQNDKCYYKYDDLLELTRKYCKQFILVMRSDLSMKAGENAKKILSELKPHLTYEDYSNSWGGTTISGYTEINYYNLNKETIEILKKYSWGLLNWVHPNLPEDLCFFKDHNTPWLLSITHERDFYFVNPSKEELESIKQIGIKLRRVEGN
jgi:hypothetical protein